MTVIPNEGDFEVSMGFEEATETELTEENPKTELAEEILLLGFLGGLRRIQDECRALKAEHDVLMGVINQEQLAQVMTDINDSYLRSQGDIDTAVEYIDEYLNKHTGENTDGN